MEGEVGGVIEEDSTFYGPNIGFGNKVFQFEKGIDTVTFGS